MIRKYVIQVQDWADAHLRRLCGRITPEKRLAVLLMMFVLFSATSLYIFVSAIYSIGKNEGRQIEHIQMLELQKRDSMNHLNYYDNARE